MSKVKVQCSGSGRDAKVGLNAKRASCPSCGRQQDVTNNGKIRKHMRLTSKAKLKKLQ